MSQDLASNIESLRKILELECKKGFSDKAVMGGLDKFLARWAGQISPFISGPRLLKRFQELHIAKSNYAVLTALRREEWIKSLLTFIEEFAAQKPGAASRSGTPALPVTKKPSRPRPAARVISQPLDAPVISVKGISTVLAKKFNKLGIETIRDLLYFFPNRHIDYSEKKNISQISEGEHTIIANVWEARETRLGSRRGTEAIVGDETGNIRIVWFNQPYLARTLSKVSRIVVSGRVGLFGGRYVFESPEWEVAEDRELLHTGRLVPLYPLTSGLSHRQMRRLIKPAVDQYASLLEDFLPAEVKKRCQLLELTEAIRQAHYPEDIAQKDKARVRLAFDELILLQLGVLSRKRDWKENKGNALSPRPEVLNTFLSALPFKLTEAQDRALREVLEDLQKPQPMSRLLQGDVGSGKTVVATAALMVAAANGYQGAFMAPTEILAEQHFANICKLLSQVGRQEGEGRIYTYSGFLPRPLTLALLTGDIKQLEKQGLHRRILEGEIDIAIGTHALIQKDVEFCRLGLAVVDEQHRFGVTQRSALRQKGASPHVLVMTATPIPRTLALTLYGDLDLSVIDQLPPGRQVIKTKWLSPEQRDSAYSFLRRQIQAGRQAFIICPLVEESEAIQAKAAVAEYERLSREIFPDLRLGLLHGRMRSAEKDDVMQRFRCGELDILVSTPVVEVGIDVPNATVMLIESADRFGLSQLHQFRGRVGRGQEQSYCLLLAEHPSEIGRQRLDIIEKTQNGFILAEEDLKLRGPGEFFGTRQSGLPDLKMARLSDVAILELARKEATGIFQIDPDLKKREHQLLAKEMAKVWRRSITEWS